MSEPKDVLAARERLRALGLRWTSQRRAILEVVRRSEGHVSGAELVERCRAIDPATTPSTVYRTLDVLEALSILRHGHGADGREEYHVMPGPEHGHLHCRRCGSTSNLAAAELEPFVAGIRRRRGFVVDLSHVTVVGLCAACATAGPGAAGATAGPGAAVASPRPAAVPGADRELWAADQVRRVATAVSRAR
ncbi:MAG TPA: Fur family transcriptional regulator [Candidatus Limnocylindrales bacterium]